MKRELNKRNNTRHDTNHDWQRNEEWFVSSFFHFHFLWLISCFRSSLLHYIINEPNERKRRKKQTHFTSWSNRSFVFRFFLFFLCSFLASLTHFFRSVHWKRAKEKKRKEEGTNPKEYRDDMGGGWVARKGKVRKERSEWRAFRSNEPVECCVVLFFLIGLFRASASLHYKQSQLKGTGTTTTQH